MSQGEDPKDLASIALFKMRFEPGACRTSGAQIRDFEHGWAIQAMPWSDTAHYFRRLNDVETIARCGFRGQVRWMFGQGSFKRCRLCQRSVDRKPPPAR